MRYYLYFVGTKVVIKDDIDNRWPTIPSISLLEIRVLYLYKK